MSASGARPTFRALLRGSSLRVLNQFLGLGISLALLPFLLHALGQEQFGIWLLASTLVGYLPLLTLGVPNALQRTLVQGMVAADEDALRRAFASSIAVLTLVAIGCALIALLMAGLLTPVFASGADLQALRSIVGLMGVAAAPHLVVFAFNALLVARSQFDLLAGLDTARIALRAAATYVVIRENPSLLALAAVNIVFDLLMAMVVCTLAVRKTPWIVWHPRWASRAEAIELLKYGIFDPINSFANRTRAQAGALILPLFVPIEQITYLRVANQLADYIQQLRSSLLGVFAPLLVRLHSEGNRDELVGTYFSILRVAMVLTLIVVGGVIVFGQSFITLWLGPTYVVAYPALVLVMVGLGIAATDYVHSQLAWAIGHAKRAMWVTVAESMGVVLLCLALVPTNGFIGAAAASAVAAGMFRLGVLPIVAARCLGIPATQVYLLMLRVSLGAVLPQLPVWWWLHTVQLDSWLSLMFVAVASYLPVAMLAAGLALGARERAWIMERLRRRGIGVRLP